MSQNKTYDESYKNDFQTPDNVAKYMVSLLPAWIKTVLEPTPGMGSLVKRLKERDLQITEPADYWCLDKKQRFDAVVGNLPFSSKTFFNCPLEYDGKGIVVAYDQMKVLMQMSVVSQFEI